ncbi:aminotransferase class V-fold PLP-dependent enzyme [Helicobacter sp. MIT 21-1697]|uniref:aminotransferase class V-fold PLP-dependent enzyme n=1 Tax=Helicobacter sp. MIT 21-1697 TaxID=2993733 RepID=UPI00224B2D9B|nr:aminotransferase class V-fold PLP-dependent enzyme [Helicobacter sp. MIT 21-1697]MCX2716711.1 aminotransferase class V-fold PLP-dependent enzyme [Helicobacter sp. MIT 21-1697]
MALLHTHSKIAKLIHHFFAPLLDSRYDKLSQLRSNTILDSKHYYFDFTASGLAYKAINKRIESILPYYANTHSHIASNATLMSELYAEAKESIADALGLSKDFVLIAGGSGASFGIKKFQEIMGIYVPPRSLSHLQHLNTNLFLPKPTFLQQLKDYDKHTRTLCLPQVIISGFEHHSNEMSYREGLCHLHKITFNKEGLPDIKHLEKILKNIKKENTHSEIIASLSVASNVTGILTPLESCIGLLRDYRAIISLDMASSSPYMQVDSTNFDAAFLSPHKLLGGVGACGILAIRKSLLNTDLPPTFAGGGVIQYANDTTHCFIDDIALREEAGTPPILGLLYGALAYKLRNEVGLEWIRCREKILTQAFLYELEKIPAISIYGDLSAERLGIVSFNIGSISPLDLCALLSKKFGIQTRAGCSCAGPYGHYLIPDGSYEKKPMWLRVSIHYTHTIRDIEYLIDSIKTCVKILRGSF